MKKLIIAAILAVSLTGFAQEGKKKPSYTEKAIEKMTMDLSLTADQQAKLKPLYEAKGELKKDDKANPDHVEDNKLNQTITKKILEKNHLSCIVANNGIEAIEMAKSNTIDLILKHTLRYSLYSRHIRNGLGLSKFGNSFWRSINHNSFIYTMIIINHLDSKLRQL